MLRSGDGSRIVGIAVEYWEPALMVSCGHGRWASRADEIDKISDERSGRNIDTWEPSR